MLGEVNIHALPKQGYTLAFNEQQKKFIITSEQFGEEDVSLEGLLTKPF
jgi:hypothetical protein